MWFYWFAWQFDISGLYPVPLWVNLVLHNKIHCLNLKDRENLWFSSVVWYHLIAESIRRGDGVLA